MSLLSDLDAPENYYYSFHINHSDDHWPATLLGMPFCNRVMWDTVRSPFYPQCYLMSGRFYLTRNLGQDRLKSFLLEAHVGFTAHINSSDQDYPPLDLVQLYPGLVTHHSVTTTQPICICALNNISQFCG